MSNWPSISPPDYGMTEEIYKPQVRTETDSNYILTRPRATRSRGRWKLSWDTMTEADYQTLKTFFIANQGSSFTWTHPITGSSYTCVFQENSLQSSAVFNGFRSVSCAIEEV